jgi:hypothetical protein
LGMSLTTYLDGSTASEKRLRKTLLEYVGAKGYVPVPTKLKGKKGGGYQKDPKLRLQIEEAAMEFVRQRYDKLGWDVDDVSDRNYGWDYDATMGKRVLHLEVKGCSSGILSCELTPNEYTKSQEYRDTYAICIVTKTLTKRPKLSEFTFHGDSSSWRDNNGNSLRFKERVAASLSVTGNGKG